MKKLIATVALVSCFGLIAAAKDSTLVGRVADSSCGTGTNAACVKKCWTKGAKAMIVTRNGKKYTVSNMSAVKAYAGDLVRVQGDVSGTSVKVEKVKVLKAAKASSHAMSGMSM